MLFFVFAALVVNGPGSYKYFVLIVHYIAPIKKAFAIMPGYRTNENSNIYR